MTHSKIKIGFLCGKDLDEIKWSAVLLNLGDGGLHPLFTPA